MYNLELLEIYISFIRYKKEIHVFRKDYGNKSRKEEHQPSGRLEEAKLYLDEFEDR